MWQTGFRLGVSRGEIRWDPQLVYEIQEDGCWKGKSCYMSWDSGRDPELIERFGQLFTASVLSNHLWDLEWDGEDRKVAVSQ